MVHKQASISPENDNLAGSVVPIRISEDWKHIAEPWGLTTRRVQIMCAEDLIQGAVKFGRSWAILEDAEKPVDGRITTGEYKNWRKGANKKSE